MHSYIRTIFSKIISCLYSSIHPPEIEADPPKTVCGCPFGGTVKKTATHAVPSPYGMQLSMYSCISRGTPSVFSWGMLQQQDRFFSETSPFIFPRKRIPNDGPPSFNDNLGLMIFLYWLCEQITSHKTARGSTVECCTNRESWPHDFYSSHVRRPPLIRL